MQMIITTTYYPLQCTQHILVESLGMNIKDLYHHTYIQRNIMSLTAKNARYCMGVRSWFL